MDELDLYLGIKFIRYIMTCKQCGKCCNTLILPALEYDEEIIKMREGFVGKVKFKGDTYFVLNAKCTYLN